MEKVAFLGLGAMGSRMVPHIINAGFDVTVWNRSPEGTRGATKLGAEAAQTPKAAVDSADFVISMLRDNEASAEVWLNPQNGAIHALKPGAVAIEVSTVSPEWILQLASEVKRAGATLLDAPVAGSLQQVEDRKLVFLVGGDIEAFAKAHHVLECMALAVHHMGSSGQGSRMKLAVNALLGIQIAALAEWLAIIGKSEMSGDRFEEVLASMSMVGPAALGYSKLMRSSDYAPRFPLELMTKDFRYAVEVAEKAGVDANVLSSTLDSLEKGCELGFGAENASAVAKVYL